MSKFYREQLFESDPNTKVFHTRMELTEHACVGVVNCLSAPEHVDGICEFALKIPGVTHVQVERHKITLVKAPLYEWSEIDGKMKELLKFSNIPELLKHPIEL